MNVNSKKLNILFLSTALFVGSIACMEEGPKTLVVDGKSFEDLLVNCYKKKEESLGKAYDLIEHRKGNISPYYAEPLLSCVFDTKTFVGHALMLFTKNNDNVGDEGESVMITGSFHCDQDPENPSGYVARHIDFQLDEFKKLITLGGVAPAPAPQKFDKRHVARVFDGPFLCGGERISAFYKGTQHEYDYTFDESIDDEELDDEHTLFSDTGRIKKNDTSDERTVVYRSPSVHVKNDAESNSFWTTKEETCDEVTLCQVRKKDLEELGESAIQSAIRRTTTRETQTKVLVKAQSKPTALSYGLVGVALIAIAVKMYSWFGMGK